MTRCLSSLLDGPADDAVAVFAGDVEITWRALRTHAREIGSRLTAEVTAADARRGPDDEPAVVAIVALGGATTLAALFGCWQAGAIAAPINARLGHDDLDRALTASGATLVLADTAASDRHVGVWAGRAVVLIDASTADNRLAAKPVDASDASTVDVPAPHPTPPGEDDTALVLTTSGTTGAPKPVRLTHAGVLDGIDAVLRKLGVDPDRQRAADEPMPMPNLVPVPLALWAGVYNTLFAFRLGAPVVLLDPFSTSGFAEIVRRHQLRSTVLAPAMMAMLTDDPAITDLAPLRIVRSVTAPLSPLHARRFHERFGVTVLNSYGQTELGGEVIGWNAADARAYGSEKLGALGRPHDGVSVRVLEVADRASDPTAADDDTPRDAPPGVEGELAIRSSSMNTDDPEVAARLLADGHLRTGDLGRLDQDGFVWISGRVSDLVIRGGLKVFPDEVEEVLRAHPSVADVAVAGVPDERLGEVPWAWIVPRRASATADSGAADAGSIDRDALDAWVRERLAPYKVPAGYVVVGELPRNAVGKLLRRELIATAMPARPIPSEEQP